MGFVSLAVVLISTLTFILQTLPEFEDDSTYPTFVHVLEAIDETAIIFFTLEYLVRFLCAPKKCRFFKRFISDDYPVI